MDYPIAKLDIIGCREIPAKPFLPRLLTPVFAVRDTDTVLLPPFHLLAHLGVFDPEVTTRAEFEDLCARERLQSISVRPAQPNNQLYLNTDGDACYAHRDWATARMADYARDHWAKAMETFLKGDFENAVLHARIARSASPSNVEPLLLQAAALKRLDRGADARVCRTFALTRISAETFEHGVKQWLAKSPVANRAKFCDIATVKPRDLQFAIA